MIHTLNLTQRLNGYHWSIVDPTGTEELTGDIIAKNIDIAYDTVVEIVDGEIFGNIELGEC